MPGPMDPEPEPVLVSDPELYRVPDLELDQEADPKREPKLEP
jgi:hypothetical protein